MMRFFRQQNNHLLDFDWSIASIYETLTDECAPFTITLLPDKDVESTKAITVSNLTNPIINSGTASRDVATPIHAASVVHHSFAIVVLEKVLNNAI
jgi:hypothetical protein